MTWAISGLSPLHRLPKLPESTQRKQARCSIVTVTTILQSYN
jgi:hypothetical protein